MTTNNKLRLLETIQRVTFNKHSKMMNEEVAMARHTIGEIAEGD